MVVAVPSGTARKRVGEGPPRKGWPFPGGVERAPSILTGVTPPGGPPERAGPDTDRGHPTRGAAGKGGARYGARHSGAGYPPSRLLRRARTRVGVGPPRKGWSTPGGVERVPSIQIGATPPGGPPERAGPSGVPDIQVRVTPQRNSGLKAGLHRTLLTAGEGGLPPGRVAALPPIRLWAPCGGTNGGACCGNDGPIEPDSVGVEPGAP